MHNNTCRIISKTDQVNLGYVGTLLGFEKNKVVPAGSTVDSEQQKVHSTGLLQV